MAAELETSLGVIAILHAGGKGIFDVLLDDQLIFSKYQTGRFPGAGEVTEMIRELRKL